jgi:hypothetical protein
LRSSAVRRGSASDFERQAVRFEQIERHALQVERMLKFMGQDDGDGSRVMAPIAGHARGGRPESAAPSGSRPGSPA